MTDGGYLDRILRVDLTQEKMWVEIPEKGVLRKFLGGVGLGAKIMYDEVPPEVKAYDPENRLIFMTGPFTGTAVQSSSNLQVITQNPITGCNIAVSNSHGFWAARLKFAGFDCIVVQGAAKKPVYLWVHDGECEIRDASKMWGRADSFETEVIVKKEVGQSSASVATIGPAGEHLCAGTMVENDHGHIAGKGNTGSVMGSKHLKAVAVYGTARVPVAHMSEFTELARKWREESLRMAAGINAYGTAGDLPMVHELGDLPVKNFLTGVFPEYEKLSGRYMRTTFRMRRNPCFSCTLAHCQLMQLPEGPHGGLVEEPEYEDMANLGSNIMVSDPGEVAWLTDYTDRLGFDGNWAGAVVGWGMEAYEKGIITKQDLGGLELHWGDVDAAAEFLRMIAYREGIGDTLALGLKTGAEKIGGKQAAAFAVHIKGETNHAHDARALWGVFLGLCISGAGPRWESESVDLAPDPEIGITEPQDRFKVEGKADAARRTQLKKLFVDSLGVCAFGIGTMDTMIKAYTALTGWPLTLEGAFLIGERVANVQRAFNVRHGFKPEFDLDVSPRLLEAPPDGGAKGKSIAPYLKGMVQEYNALMDWDWDTGRPSHTKLTDLGLEDVEESLYA